MRFAITEQTIADFQSSIATQAYHQTEIGNWQSEIGK